MREEDRLMGGAMGVVLAAHIYGGTIQYNDLDMVVYICVCPMHVCCHPTPPSSAPLTPSAKHTTASYQPHGTTMTPYG